jgi:Leucine-rich repeat (LRR) protein
MENLHIFSGLIKLELPNHRISRIESLDILGRLEELNLNGNPIREIKNVFHLRSLRILDLSHTSIDDIPTEIRSLSALQILHVSHCRIHSLRSVARLSSNESLSHLSVQGNPLCKSEHWKLFIIYHLPQLDGIDRDTVTVRERQEAVERFERGMLF